MADDGTLMIDEADPEEGARRVVRAIIMVADGAIERLTALGWRRKSVNLELDPEDPLPCWVRVRKRRVFEISQAESTDGGLGGLGIQCEWLDGQPVGPGIIERFMGW